jgi:hypothetical protein
MTLHTLSLFIRGSVNPGVIAGTAVATEEEDKHNKNVSTRGRIIGAAVAVVLLIVIIVFAVCYDRSKKRKARQGTKLRNTGAGEIDEEARPMVQGPVGVPPPLMMQPGGTYFHHNISHHKERGCMLGMRMDRAQCICQQDSRGHSFIEISRALFRC